VAELRAAAADEVPLNALIGPAAVIEAGEGLIDAAFIERQELTEVERVLFRTPNSRLPGKGRFTVDFTALDKGAAEALVRAGVRLVGIDYLSIEREGDGDFPVHKTLLKAGVVILEGLDLSGVRPGRYELICLPLKIRGDGAPARAVLIERD
jgi:arylformamidase